MNPDVVVAPLPMLLERLIEDVREESARANARRGLFAMALTGGSVGVFGFPALATVPFDWNLTHLFWGDERAVPTTSDDSNFGLARKLWLTPAGVTAAAIHRMPADNPDLNAAAHHYRDEILRVLGASPRFDHVLLGVGPDGHVASLFPGHPALSEERELVLPIVDSPKPPPRRLTLTMPMLTGAERVVVMALGNMKAAAMKEALTRDDSSLPVALVLRRSRRPLVLLDRDASSHV